MWWKELWCPVQYQIFRKIYKYKFSSTNLFYSNCKKGRRQQARCCGLPVYVGKSI
ncbi:hypothetical protein FCL48_10750 [Desulforhopalus sp. IMCC35007]|nr:hypothetical protein FCL48_10750 [Desulforhopalus sp. IMCC35007]